MIDLFFKSKKTKKKKLENKNHFTKEKKNAYRVKNKRMCYMCF